MAVCEVQGCGLMLALRFHTHVLVELSAVANELRPVTCSGVPPALLLHVYLLREHGVRTRPTDGTLMLDMPAVATETSVQRVCSAVQALERVLATEAFEEVLSCW